MSTPPTIAPDVTDERDLKLIAAARDNYANDEINIDDNATFSRAEEGTWVSAWVWVNHEEIGEKFDGTEDGDDH